MSESRYVVVGRKGTGLHDRLPIEYMQKNEPRQFSLFILAYLAIQGRAGHDATAGILPSNIPIPEAASFYHLSGVHGLPFEAWIGDKRSAPENRGDFDPLDPKDMNPVPSRFGGYCNHGSVVFPTWHRPYVMAIEQSIGNVVEDIAKQMKDNEPKDGKLWINAAHAFRFPFWDWAEEKVQHEGMPPVLYEETVHILLPGGEYREVPNPLSHFEFTVVPNGFKNESAFQGEATAYFAEWTRTYRYAESSPHPGESGVKKMNEAIKQQAKQIREHVAELFTYDNDCTPSLAWDEFSNHTTQSMRQMDFRNITSLEGIHDSMHDIIGGNGHMANPDYAAFDPIFWLHHCNVDRIYALWEYLYPQYNMGDGYPFKDPYTGKMRIASFTQSRGTYDAVYNSSLDQSTALAPFRMENGEYWTSSAVGHLDNNARINKYYSYPEVAGVKVDRNISNNDRIRLRAELRKYYGFDPEAEKKPIYGGSKVAQLYHIASSVPEGFRAIEGYRHFVVIVQTSEFTFNGPYSIQLTYVGESEENVEFIGSVSVFARPDHSACQGCIMRRDAGSTIRGTITIPPKIIKDLATRVLALLSSDDDSLSFLKDRLRGTILNKSGETMGVAQGRSLGMRDSSADSFERFAVPDITLVSAAAAVKPDGDFKWFDWKNHGKVFQGGHKTWAKVNRAARS